MARYQRASLRCQTATGPLNGSAWWRWDWASQKSRSAPTKTMMRASSAIPSGMSSACQRRSSEGSRNCALADVCGAATSRFGIIWLLRHASASLSQTGPGHRTTTFEWLQSPACANSTTQRSSELVVKTAPTWSFRLLPLRALFTRSPTRSRGPLSLLSRRTGVGLRWLRGEVSRHPGADLTASLLALVCDGAATGSHCCGYQPHQTRQNMRSDNTTVKQAGVRGRLAQYD